MGSQARPPPGGRSCSEPRGHLAPRPCCSLLLTAWGRLGRQGPASAADEGQQVSLGSPQVAGKGEEAGGRTQGRPPGSPCPLPPTPATTQVFAKRKAHRMNTRAWPRVGPSNLQLGQHLHSGPDVHDLERPRRLGAGWAAKASVPCVLRTSLVQGPGLSKLPGGHCARECQGLLSWPSVSGASLGPLKPVSKPAGSTGTERGAPSSGPRGRVLPQREVGN